MKKPEDLGHLGIRKNNKKDTESVKNICIFQKPTRNLN